jgi:hypothetical protein
VGEGGAGVVSSKGGAPGGGPLKGVVSSKGGGSSGGGPLKGGSSLERVSSKLSKRSAKGNSSHEGSSLMSSKGGGSSGGPSFSWAALDKALIKTIAAASVTAVRSKAIRLNIVPPSSVFAIPLGSRLRNYISKPRRVCKSYGLVRAWLVLIGDYTRLRVVRIGTPRAAVGERRAGGAQDPYAAQQAARGRQRPGHEAREAGSEERRS